MQRGHPPPWPSAATNTMLPPTSAVDRSRPRPDRRERKQRRDWNAAPHGAKCLRPTSAWFTVLLVDRERNGSPRRALRSWHDDFGERKEFVCVRVLSSLLIPPASIIAAVGHDMPEEVLAP
jgi:hypothetical protein